MARPIKYKFYTDGSNKIVAVSSYAGKSVRGVAKCDPRDEFDLSSGQDLAVARCNMKIAEKRCNRAQKEYRKAVEAYHAANNRLQKMSAYVTDSNEALKAAKQDLETITSSL